jgi:ATP-dependent HslUV protease subunit HslV
MPQEKNRTRSTTVLAVRRDGRTVMGGDGQVSLKDTVLKQGANKVRRLYHGKVLAGFAGATADSITLFEKFDGYLERHKGNLARAAIEMAKEWRTDRVLRRLEAMLIVADSEQSFLLSGSGDVIEPDDEVLAIGSGGPYALAAARALLLHTEMGALEIAETSLRIAAEICVYTNDRIHVESL